MGRIRIYDDENGQYYNVNMELKYSVLDNGDGSPEWYILLTTSIMQLNGTPFAPQIIQSLSDIPPDQAVAASSFTELMQWWISYYMTITELGQSSSSSSESSSSSSTSSEGYSESSSSSEGYSESSSSSEGYSESSSSDSSDSSSSSSEGYSESSSSSSEGYSESSSSEGYSESSSSSSEGYSESSSSL